jgi:hypothetical protein
MQQARAAIPLALALALTATYGLFFYLYIECRWNVSGCQRVNVAGIYLPESDIINLYPEDKTTPAEKIETSLREAADERERVAQEFKDKLEQREKLQQQALDVAAKVSHLAGIPQPSEQETTEYVRLKDVYDRIDKEKTEADALLEVLKVRKERLDAQVQNLHGRLEVAHKRAVERHNMRLIWVLFTGLFVFACLGVFFVTLYVPHRLIGGGWLLLGALALLYTLYGLIRQFADGAYKTVFEEMVELLFGKNPPALYGLFETMGNTAALALVVTTFFVLWHPASFFVKEEDKFDEKLAELSRRRKYLRAILYAGTALLVVGILRMRVLLDWLQGSILQEELGKSVDDFSKVFITFQGVLYTLLLAAVYLPARQIIADCARNLPVNEAEKKDREEKLAAAGFGPSETIPFKDYLPKAAALLAPMLIGPVAELVKKIFE